MDDGTDVDRMLARLGENNIQYREFGHTVIAPSGPWDPNAKSRPPIDAAPPATPSATWNTGHLATPPLRPEPLLVDPEAPGGRLADIPQAQQRGIPTPDAIADGRTPPAPVAPAVPAPLIVPAPAIVPAPVSRVAPVTPPAPAAATPSGSLGGMFHRVSGTPQSTADTPNPAPLSALFKRLS